MQFETWKLGLLTEQLNQFKKKQRINILFQTIYFAIIMFDIYLLFYSNFASILLAAIFSCGLTLFLFFETVYQYEILLQYMGRVKNERNGIMMKVISVDKH